MSLQQEIPSALIPLKINLFTGFFLPYFVVFVKFGAKVEVGCKMTESMAQDLLSVINTPPDEQKGIGHIITPWCEGRIPVNKDVLKGHKLMLVPLLDSKRDLIVDIVI